MYYVAVSIETHAFMSCHALFSPITACHCQCSWWTSIRSAAGRWLLLLWEGNPVGPPLCQHHPWGLYLAMAWGFPGEQAWTCLHGAMCMCNAVSRQTDWSLELSLCAHLDFSLDLLYYAVLWCPSVLYGELVCRSHLYLSWLQYWRFSAEFSAYLRELCPNGKIFSFLECVRRVLNFSATRRESVWSSRGDGSN